MNEQEDSVSDLIIKYNGFAEYLFTKDDFKDPEVARALSYEGIHGVNDETFEKIRQLINDREEKQRDEHLLNTFIPHLEKSLQKAYIEKFVKEHFPDALAADHRTLVSYVGRVLSEEEDEGDRMSRMLSRDRAPEVEALDELLKKGIPFAQAELKKPREKSGEAKKTSPWKYIWSVIQNLIALIIAIAIFGIASDNFQTVVLAILVMIYLAVMGVGMGLGAIWEIIPAYLTIGTDEKKKEEVEKGLMTRLPTLWIDGAFLFVIWVIALWHLVAAL